MRTDLVLCLLAGVCRPGFLAFVGAELANVRARPRSTRKIIRSSQQSAWNVAPSLRLSGSTAQLIPHPGAVTLNPKRAAAPGGPLFRGFGSGLGNARANFWIETAGSPLEGNLEAVRFAQCHNVEAAAPQLRCASAFTDLSYLQHKSNADSFAALPKRVTWTPQWLLIHVV
jgi:hypothetical protein